jgi:hypothetical protein
MVICCFLYKCHANRLKNKYTFIALSHDLFITCKGEKDTVLIQCCAKYNDLICGSLNTKTLTMGSSFWRTGCEFPSTPVPCCKTSVLFCMILVPALPLLPWNQPSWSYPINPTHTFNPCNKQKTTSAYWNFFLVWFKCYCQCLLFC